MKKVFMMLLSVLTIGFGAAACSDSDNAQGDGGGTPADSTHDVKSDTVADYTVIFWGMGGALDPAATYDLATMANNFQTGVTGKNVNVAGIYKTSLSLWGRNRPDMVTSDADKTYYFDSRINPDCTIPADFLTYHYSPDMDELQAKYKVIFAALNGRVVGDADYSLSSEDSLANFIRQTAEAFPARHYVLLLWGHGNGFVPSWDYVPTRVCVYDDITSNCLAADNIVNAVQKSGVKMQTIFTQCCQMGALENMAAYSKCFDYGVLSAEATGSFYMPQYITKLSEAGDDEAKMVEKTRELVDYYADRNSVVCTSHGLYDLRKTSGLLALVKEAADWYAANYADSMSESEINRALRHAVFYDDIADTDHRELRKLVQKYLDEGVDGLAGDKRTALTEVFKAWATLNSNYGNKEQASFCMADVMNQTLKAKLPQDKIAQLQAIYDRYIAALKDMAYIKTTQKPEKAVADYEYIYASPTVNVFSLHPDYYFKDSGAYTDENIATLVDAMLSGDDTTAKSLYHKMFEWSVMYLSSLEPARKLYRASAFDQQVGWVNFLEKLKVNPSIMTNPDREQVNEEMK